ncbi:uncharacterized protein LOC144532208 isoform X2 [Sander vitreus]
MDFGEHRPTAPFPTIEAAEGDDVALQCRLDPPVNLSARTSDVAGAVLGIYGDVDVYRKGKDRMDRRGGIVTLLSDAGEHNVFLQKLRAHSVINVTVESNDQQNGTKTGPPVEQATESNNRGGGNGKAGRGRIIPAVLFILCVVIVLIVVLNAWNAAPSLTSTGGPLAHNFAEILPTEISAKIFGELDAESLCSASRTCRLWHDIIEESEQVWRRQCLPVRALCQREVDGDRRDGLSWKVTLVKNYRRSCVKGDWLRGRYSHVRSAEELSGRKMAPLDAETWGEILQAELDR